MHNVTVRLDRMQVVSWAPQGRKPPPLKGFAITRDSFVRCQTTTVTYARCRQYRSKHNDSKVYWQYQRQKGWLKPWKITVVADDKAGLSYDEIDSVLSHCRYYRFLIVEVAIDFSHSTGVNKEFVCQHCVFGKSRRAHTIEDRILYWGGRKSEKLVRCYEKPEVDGYRVEVELHSKLLQREQILTLDDFDGLPGAILPHHVRFVDVDWDRLRQHLVRKHNGRALIAGAQMRAPSLSRLRRYLRRHGIANFHRFLVPLAINQKIDRALTRWIRDFEAVA
jgi:hypothetical protein